MTLNSVKLGRAITFKKYLASAVSLIFLPKTLIWNKNHVSAIKFTESCRGSDKLAYEKYLHRNLLIFLFVYDLSRLIVKISGASN